MPKEFMKREAAQNEYLHKDFHGALSRGILYLQENYGDDAVREYLRDFTRSYYAPLIGEIQSQGLPALQAHFERIYAIEGVDIDIELTADEMVLKVAACPAVTHMRVNNYAVAPLWCETIRTVNEALCEGSDFVAELAEYDEESGGSVQRFTRRAQS